MVGVVWSMHAASLCRIETAALDENNKSHSDAHQFKITDRNKDKSTLGLSNYIQIERTLWLLAW